MNTYPDPIRDIYDADAPGLPRAARPRTWRRALLEVAAAALFGAVVFCAVVAFGGFKVYGQTLEQAAPLPVAAWFQPVRNFDKLQALNVDTLFGPECENAGALPAATLRQHRLAWIGDAKARGLKMVLKKPTAEELALAGNACVGVLADIDEPNGKGKTAADLAADVAELRRLAPGKRLFISLAGDKVTDVKSSNRDYAEKVAYYNAFAQLLGDNGTFTVNNYSANRNASRYAMSWTGDAVNTLRGLTGCDVWAWFECNDQQLPPPKPADGVNRAPTPAEIRAQVTDAVRRGAKGVGWFTTQDKGKYGWPESYLPQVDRDGRSMAPQYAAVAQISAELRGIPYVPPATQPATQPSTQPTTQPATQPTTQPTPEVIARLEAKIDAKAAELDARVQQLDARLQRIRAAFEDPAPATQPATQPAAFKPVFNSVLKQGDPPGAAALKQVTWGHVSRYIDRPHPRPPGDPGIYTIPAENIRAFARVCRDGGVIDGVVITAGAPVMLDWENYYDPRTTPDGYGRGRTPQQVAEVLRGYIRTFKAEAPGLKVGVYPITGLAGPARNEEWADGVSPAERAAAIASDPVSLAIAEECDWLAPSPYLLGPSFVERDLLAYRNGIRLVKERWPGKPVYPVVWSHYAYNAKDELEDTPYPREVGRTLAALMLEEGDGLILWPGLGWDWIEKVYAPATLPDVPAK